VSSTTDSAKPGASLRRPWRFAVLLVALAALWPAAAHGQSHTFVNTDRFGPSEEGGTTGPAGTYPGTVSVAGVGGTVTKVTLTVIELTASEDLDMALVGPNGAQVMLMSDACSGGASKEVWTFDDAAPVFVSSGSCPFGQRSSVRPTNFGDPDNDKLDVKGGPAGPFGNSLSVFNGISPDGDWKLFLLDDTAGSVGFSLPAFALHLEVTPPPPPPPTIVTVQVPAPPTGKRAKALAKCKSKTTQEAKKRCRNNARKLPV
jgi:subtilisin-like proprotein convertase family protein